MGKMIENYSLLNEIGRGMYSTVFKAINIKTKQEVAIKVVKAEKFKQYPKLQEGTYNEINILNNLEACPHIIKYYDMLKTVNNFYFVYEYCNGGTLQKLLRQCKSIPESPALTYFAQIVQAFKVLKKNNIMHRDLKPQNLLLHDGQIKLADFGFCKPLESQDQMSKTMLGSPIYMAPQILKGEGYSIKSDIWSLGVVLFRMIYGFCPFQSNNIGKLIMIIQEEQMVIPAQPQVSPELVKLLKRMLTKNSTLRADWAEVFAYEVHNGVLVRQGVLRPKTPSGLKRSFNLSETTKASMQSSMRLRTQQAKTEVQQKSQGPMQKSDMIFQPKVSQEPRISNVEVRNGVNSELRTTYSGKSNFSQNFKRDNFIKNHQKCIDLMSLSIGMLSFESAEALGLSQIINMGAQKQLRSILQSAKKQTKNKDALFDFLVESAETELQQVNLMISEVNQQLGTSLGFAVGMLETRKKEVIQKFAYQLEKANSEELGLACRVVNYIIDGIVIRKQTLERMTRDKLQSILKSKVYQQQ